MIHYYASSMRFIRCCQSGLGNETVGRYARARRARMRQFGRWPVVLRQNPESRPHCRDLTSLTGRRSYRTTRSNGGRFAAGDTMNPVCVLRPGVSRPERGERRCAAVRRRRASTAFHDATARALPARPASENAGYVAHPPRRGRYRGGDHAATKIIGCRRSRPGRMEPSKTGAGLIARSRVSLRSMRNMVSRKRFPDSARNRRRPRSRSAHRSPTQP
jgi:hypothetical protein